MMRCIKLIAIAAFCSISVAAYAEEPMPDFVLEAREAAITFQKALKHELMSAMQSGGPKKAVEICHSHAPEIAEEIGQQTGWKIGRTSLKTRNEINMPDATEREILQQFETRKENGESASTLEWWQENEGSIAYMKAIPMKGMCASCHGSNISPSLKKQISQYYPSDMATGFAVGDVRGAFTLKKYMEVLSGKASE